MPSLSESLTLLSVMALPFMFAVTLHEAGHAYAANALGDITPKSQGRLSLNPFRHFDPVGTVLIPMAAVLFAMPFLIGYAKPVMIRPEHFKNKRRDMIAVALAGPLMNLLLAVAFAYAIRFALWGGAAGDGWLVTTAVYGVFMNCLFMVFNLLPIPPLDGSGVVAEFLPEPARSRYLSVAPFGFFILIGLILLAKEVVLGPTLFFFETINALVGVPV
ncbi:site-2 protease family protein [Yunchengibacter salinarum]|uniref:site-2 protease family protein n=1 Tax=Yunchengibacter salinarum TaxID=3133399 RepID=UPI0035B68930